jgi:hypothetical protein
VAGAASRRRAGRKGSVTLAPFAAWLTARALEVAFNAWCCIASWWRRASGSAVIVRRFLRPPAVARQGVQATVRLETAPGQQAQVVSGSAIRSASTMWRRSCCLPVGVLPAHHCLRHQARLDVLAGHERAFQHFGGVPGDIVLTI